MDSKYWLDPRFIYKNLERFFSEERICGLFNIPSTDKGIVVSVIDMNENDLIIKTAAIDGIRPIIVGSKTLTTFTDSGKVQFEIHNFRPLQNGSYSCDLPKKIALIQRRKGFRTLGPGNFDRDFKLLIYYVQGKEIIAQVVDISEDGLQLDLRLGSTEMTPGTIWQRCSFERLKIRSEPFDLIIKNTRMGQETSRIRVGCHLLNPTQRIRNQFENTRNALHTARIQRRLKFWFENLSWYS